MSGLAELKLRGGAYVKGAMFFSINASWPFASLSVTQDRFVIRVCGVNFVNCSRDLVCDISTCTIVPFLTWGVQVRFIGDYYEQEAVFFTFTKSPRKLLESIHATGFRPEGKCAEGYQHSWRLPSFFVLGVFLLFLVMALRELF